MVSAPYPGIVDLLRAIGEAGRRVADIEASEGSAGNISVCMRWPVDPRTRLPVTEQLELPDAVPELAGACLLVTGSGRRLRAIIDDPAANLGCILVDEGGKTGTRCEAVHAGHHARGAPAAERLRALTHDPGGRLELQDRRRESRRHETPQ